MNPRHFRHTTGQLATVTESGHATGGPVPFMPESCERDGWVEISQGRHDAAVLEAADAAQRVSTAIAEWQTRYDAVYRVARLAVLRGGDHCAADALLLGERVAPGDLGLEPPDLGEANEITRRQMEAAAAVTKRHAPKSRGG